MLLALSLLALGGMATANVLLPSLVKLHFPDRVGLMTSIYSTALAIGRAQLGAHPSHPPSLRLFATSALDLGKLVVSELLQRTGLDQTTVMRGSRTRPCRRPRTAGRRSAESRRRGSADRAR